MSGKDGGGQNTSVAMDLKFRRSFVPIPGLNELLKLETRSIFCIGWVKEIQVPEFMHAAHPLCCELGCASFRQRDVPKLERGGRPKVFRICLMVSDVVYADRKVTFPI